MTEKPEESEPEIVDVPLPDVGDDMTPTAEMIVQGRIGNGVHARLDSELAKTLQAERTEMRREINASRREAYEEGVKDTLSQVQDLQQGILKIGVELMKRLETGEPLSKKELDTLKLAQSTAKELADRAVGKAKTTSEVKSQSSILHLIAGIDNG